MTTVLVCEGRNCNKTGDAVEMGMHLLRSQNHDCLEQFLENNEEEELRKYFPKKRGRKRKRPSLGSVEVKKELQNIKKELLITRLQHIFAQQTAQNDYTSVTADKVPEHDEKEESGGAATKDHINGDQKSMEDAEMSGG